MPVRGLPLPDQPQRAGLQGHLSSITLRWEVDANHRACLGTDAEPGTITIPGRCRQFGVTRLSSTSTIRPGHASSSGTDRVEVKGNRKVQPLGETGKHELIRRPGETWMRPRPW